MPTNERPRLESPIDLARRFPHFTTPLALRTGLVLLAYDPIEDRVDLGSTRDPYTYSEHIRRTLGVRTITTTRINPAEFIQHLEQDYEARDGTQQPIND